MAKKVEMSQSAFDSMLRHYEKVLELGAPRMRNTKSLEAFRLASQDIKKLKRIRQRNKQ